MLEGLGALWQFPKIRVPQYRPQYTIVLIIGIPKKVPLILGNHLMVLNQSVKFVAHVELQFSEGLGVR